MSRILVLAPRAPHPLDTGDKLRLGQVVSHLAARHEVTFGGFVDGAADAATQALAERCKEVHLEVLSPVQTRLRTASGLLQGDSLSVSVLRSKRFAAWVEEVTQRVRFDAVWTVSAAMASYALTGRAAGLRRIADLCDVESERWLQHAHTRGGAGAWIDRREANRLQALESRVATEFDATVLVSERESRLLARQVPAAAGRLRVVDLAVDEAYFDPELRFKPPFDVKRPSVVFTGAMDYWPNVDAVLWFADEVLPIVQRAHPKVTFHVVGRRPVRVVRALAERPSINVTGDVADIRPHLSAGWVTVVPVRVACGVQNKLLQAFAMRRPVVATTAVLDGIAPEAWHRELRADSAEEFAGRVIRRLGDRLAFEGREYVQRRHSLARIGEQLDALFD